VQLTKQVAVSPSEVFPPVLQAVPSSLYPILALTHVALAAVQSRQASPAVHFSQRPAAVLKKPSLH
jgi:hypothetical protein